MSQSPSDENLTPEQHAEELVEQANDSVDIDKSEVKEKIIELSDEFGLPLDEARRSVKSSYEQETESGEDVFEQRNDTTLVNNINTDDVWRDVKVVVTNLDSDPHESMSQQGRVGDESGTVRFVSWEKSDVPDLEEGQAYRLESVSTDEYNGTYSIQLNSSTVVEEIDEDIEVGSDNIVFEGAMVDIQDGSGLIKRCSEEGCTRVLDKTRCQEHGDVEGESDIRIKAVLDDGHEAQDVIFDAEATEELTGMDIEDAKETFMQSESKHKVLSEMTNGVDGRFYKVEGPEMGRYLLVDEFEEVTGTPNVDDVLTQARSI